ncbi:MAG: hypothetical protein BGN96_04075 [Bacteroidales bacterium 45-6]|nr:MAG: hypothetical protein BGN96_04075 [Bacteroidales bacterium 45-6]
MKQNIRYYLLIFILLGATSCSSLDGDAKKAADLSKKSIEYTKEMKFDKAEKTYKESQEYFRKYEEKGLLKEFAKRYNEHLLGQ